ncbi:MAG: outer membrane beta-barrel protein [Bacteroidetes bacterium]|nr:outer membrane beta-barrel protein [Bacteroidota bacterium]
MKKVLILFLFVCLQNAKAQFFQGVGIFGAVNHSAHYYTNTNRDQKDANVDSPGNFPYNAYYPENHISHEYFSWGAGIFAELLNREHLRWQTEIEYTHKGAKEKELIDPFIGTRSGGFSTNKYTYIQWNNYLKFYNPIGLSSHWYIMPGIKLDYLFNSSVSAFTAYSGAFPKIFFSGDLGLGYEFPIIKNFYGFTEYHWNPDILSHHKDGVTYRNRTFELRVGIMYRPRKKRIDDCNAPRYNGPAY